MARYRLDLAYFGDAFNGWQSQKDGSAVQDAVERSLQVFLRHPVRVIGASRTDAGVHAEQQVAIFDSDMPFDHHRWLRSLHALMPKSIGVVALRAVAPDFNPLGDNTGKLYRYRLWRGEERLPFLSPYVWDSLPPLQIEAMRRAAAMLVGTHDFTSYCAVDAGAKTRVRTIVELELRERGPLVDIWVLGHGFLKQMVRTIVGTLVEVGRGAISLEEFAAILPAKNRDAAGPTAPAQGLSLVRVFFQPLPSIAEMVATADQGFALGLSEVAGT